MNARAEGFTLVELLVSMTVLALLMALLFGGLRLGTRAWEQSDTANNSVEDVRSVQSVLRTALERICPRRTAAAAPTTPTVDFTGTPHGMSFFAPEPKSFGYASCARLDLSAETAGNSTRLTVSIADADSHTREHELFRRIHDAAFAYLGANGWQDVWSGETNLPRLVRIQLRFPKGDTHVWPELYVAPRISAENDCVYSSITKTCQGS